MKNKKGIKWHAASLISLTIFLAGCQMDKDIQPKIDTQTQEQNLSDTVIEKTDDDTDTDSIAIPVCAEIVPVLQEKPEWNGAAAMEMILTANEILVSQQELAEQLAEKQASMTELEAVSCILNEWLDTPDRYAERSVDSLSENGSVRLFGSAIQNSLNQGTAVIVSVRQDLLFSGLSESDTFIVLYGYRIDAKGLSHYACATSLPEVWQVYEDGCLEISGGELVNAAGAAQNRGMAAAA